MEWRARLRQMDARPSWQGIVVCINLDSFEGLCRCLAKIKGETMLYWVDTCRFPGGGGSALLCRLHLGQHLVVRGLCRGQLQAVSSSLTPAWHLSLHAGCKRIVEE